MFIQHQLSMRNNFTLPENAVKQLKTLIKTIENFSRVWDLILNNSDNHLLFILLLPEILKIYSTYNNLLFSKIRKLIWKYILICRSLHLLHLLTISVIIHIVIQHQDQWYLPSQSSWGVLGKISQANVDIIKDRMDLVHMAICHLFFEIRYMLNAIKIDKCKNVHRSTQINSNF